MKKKKKINKKLKKNQVSYSEASNCTNPTSSVTLDSNWSASISSTTVGGQISSSYQCNSVVSNGESVWYALQSPGLGSVAMIACGANSFVPTIFVVGTDCSTIVGCAIDG